MAAPDPAEPLRRFLRIQTAAEAEVSEVLQEAAKDLDSQLKRMEDQSGIGTAVRRVQLQTVRLTLLQRIAAIWDRIGSIIQRRSIDAAISAVRSAASWDTPFLRRLGFTQAQRAAYQQRAEEAAKRSVEMGVNRRFDTTGSTNRTLSERVYHSRVLAERLVERKVESAIARGLSAKELAEEVREFIRPDVRGGISYAALRLARTELNNAFHYQQVKDAQDKAWVLGFQWRISGSHPQYDICDKIAEKKTKGKEVGFYPKDDVPDKPHPQCLCSLIPVVMDQEDFVDSLFQ